jgi:hypothetical protein
MRKKQDEEQGSKVRVVDPSASRQLLVVKCYARIYFSLQININAQR